MPKTSDAIKAATNRERVRNMKSICLHCRNGEPVEYQQEPVSNIGYWAHGLNVCAAGPIRESRPPIRVPPRASTLVRPQRYGE